MDAQGSVIRTLSLKISDVSYNGPGGSKPLIPEGRVADEVEYEPYGRASRRVDLAADFDLSGVVDVADIFAFLSAWFANDPRSDANGDGVKTTADIFAFLSLWFSTASTASLGPADSVSDPSVANPYGYCGYYSDAETLGLLGPGNGALYHVRHRVYDPAAGRWLSRDPAGFVDGMNLYGYCKGSTVRCTDPMGLFCGDPTEMSFVNPSRYSGTGPGQSFTLTFTISGPGNASPGLADSDKIARLRQLLKKYCSSSATIQTSYASANIQLANDITGNSIGQAAEFSEGKWKGIQESVVAKTTGSRTSKRLAPRMFVRGGGLWWKLADGVLSTVAAPFDVVGIAIDSYEAYSSYKDGDVSMAISSASAAGGGVLLLGLGLAGVTTVASVPVIAIAGIFIVASQAASRLDSYMEAKLEAEYNPATNGTCTFWRQQLALLTGREQRANNIVKK